MKLVPLLALAVLATGCPKHTDTATVANTPTPAAEVVLTLVPPAVGSVDTKHSTKITDVDIRAQGQKIPMHVEEVTVEHVEYREVTDVPQKVLVTYEDDHKTTTMQGQATTEATPLEHHAYVVWKDGGKIAATHDDGAAVEPDEFEKLTDRFQDEVGQFPGVAMVITGRRWTIDAPYTLDPDDLALMSQGKEGKMTAGTFTLVGQDAGNAIFDFQLAADLEGDKVEGKLDMHMRATIQISPARPVEITSEGTIDARAGGMPFAGTLHGTETYSYE